MQARPNVEYVSVAIASQRAGIPGRTIRSWIASGKLAAVRGKNGWLVSSKDVESLANGSRLAGMPGMPVVGKNDGAGNANQVASDVLELRSEPGAVTDAKTQLALIRDEWIKPFVDRIGELERERGKLEQQVEDLTRRLADRNEKRPEVLRRRWWLFWKAPAQ